MYSIKAFLRKDERAQINELNFHLLKLEEEEQINGKLIDKRGENTQWEKTVSPANGVRKTEQLMQKNETAPLSYLIYKN